MIKLNASQARRVRYEAQRAFLLAIGRGGGVLEWISLPESVRTAAEPPNPRLPFPANQAAAEYFEELSRVLRLFGDGVDWALRDIAE